MERNHQGRNAFGLLLACLILASLPYRPAYAHYLWIMQQEDLYVVARGTIPDHVEAYSPDAVTVVRAFDREGSEIPIERVHDKVRVSFRAKEPPCVAAVMCDWGSRVKTTRGKRLLTRSEAQRQGFKVLEAFLSTQTSKSLFEDGEAVCKQLGMRFELVPTKSPFQLGPGEPLDVRLFFDGAPLKDAMVSAAEQPQTKTDQKGIARVGGCKEGWNIIMARQTVSVSGNPDIDYHQFMTFLVFKLP